MTKANIGPDVKQQLDRTLALLEEELQRTDASDERLEFFYRKITLLEKYL